MARTICLIAGVVVAAVGLSSSCDRDEGASPPRRESTTSLAVEDNAATPGGRDVQAIETRPRARPRGGSARVGVWMEPDPAASTLGGAAVRALVLPQLFVPRPDGGWSPGAVEPKTDHLAPDGRSATFRFRTGLTWSDGSPVGVEDLRRSADARFVAGIEGPAADGTVTVRFTTELLGWRRLWSAQDSIAPPAPGVWGGPFVVASVAPGLETVLHRNEHWKGSGGPFLDELRLVLVPDAVMARQLLARGDLDVVMPPASTVRTPQLNRVERVSVARVARGGWSVILLANADRISLDDRQSIFATVDRQAFVGTLLAGEASVLQGFAGPEDAAWASLGVGDAAPLKGNAIDLVAFIEEPMTSTLYRSMQKRARAAGGTIEIRAAEADRVERWVREGTYGAAIMPILDPPGGCWRCRWESVDAMLAAAADAGDRQAAAALEAKLRDDARVLPLWRSDTVVAWRDGLNGVRANGYAASAAWNAWEWWRDSVG